MSRSELRKRKFARQAQLGKTAYRSGGKIVNSTNSERLAAYLLAVIILMALVGPALSQTVGLPPPSTFIGTPHRGPDGTIVVEPPSGTPRSSAPQAAPGRNSGRGASNGGGHPSPSVPTVAAPSPRDNDPPNVLPALAEAQFTQQGPKLVGTGVIGPVSPEQGNSASLSGDGETAIVGGPFDNNGAGAAWVLTRSGGVWSQRTKLVGTAALGNALQGYSVSISADGSTALVGGIADHMNTGAVWVFTRSGAVWSQEAKLVASGIPGPASQGHSVSLSGDGNTALVGGPNDDNNVGATWVFTRSGGVWSQEAKLVGTGAVGPFSANQGASVSLSGDGNTAVVGGPGDNDQTGAAWVFIRSGGVWIQQAKLVGAGVVGFSAPLQGWSVSLSGDGNTALVSGRGDSILSGATWVFTRSNGAWSQQGPKLVGEGAVGQPEQGWSVSLSGDGNTALVGGPNDDNNVGATWVFTRSGGVWSQQGLKLVGTGALRNALQGYSVSISAQASTAIVGGIGDDLTGAAWVFFSSTAPSNTIATRSRLACCGTSAPKTAEPSGR